MKRFFCWLTGGHKYEDKNLKSTYFRGKGITHFTNRCIKCGKNYHFLIDTDRIMQKDLELFKQRMAFVPLADKRSDTK